jgi:tetratricopeptide (TPR) repeat protein
MNPVSQSIYQQAIAAWHDGDKDLAFRRCCEALNADPNCAEALYLVCTCMLSKGWYGLAFNGLMKAHEMIPDQPGPMNNIGLCLRKIGQDGSAEDAWHQAKKIMKRSGLEDPDIYANLASITINAGRAEEAEMWAREALKLRPNDTTALWNLSLAELEQGKLRQGWKNYKIGYKHGLRLNKQYDCGHYKGGKAKRLVVYGEQGQGDELMFASVIPEILPKVGELILDCHPRLQALFERSFPDATVYPTRKKVDAPWVYDVGPISAKISMGDLCGLRRQTKADFDQAKPFLKTNPAFDTGIKRRSDAVAEGRPKIGIAWEGGTIETHVFDRTPDFSLFKNLINAFPQVEWFSVHYKKDSDKFLAKQGLKVHHWQEVIDNFDALTSLIGQMDLVITTDQTAVHQAGAIGQPCWVLSPERRSFRYMKAIDGEELEPDVFPWYGDHVKLFRQAADCKWEPVFEQLTQALAAFTQGARPRVDHPRVPEAAKRVPPSETRLWDHGTALRQAGA